MSGRPPGVLNHIWLPVKSGAGPLFGSRWPAAASAPPVSWLTGPPPRTSARLFEMSELDSILDVGSTSAEGRSLAIEFSNLTSRLVAITTATAIITTPMTICTWPRCARRRSDDAPPAEHHHVEHRGGADRVREGNRELAEGEGLRGGDGDHPGEDRPGARRVDEPQARADDEAAAEALAPGSGRRRDDPRDPGLDTVGERWHQQQHAKAEEHGDRELAREVVRKAERVDHVDEGDRCERERRGPGRSRCRAAGACHRSRPPRGSPAAPAARTARAPFRRPPRRRRESGGPRHKTCQGAFNAP